MHPNTPNPPSPEQINIHKTAAGSSSRPNKGTFIPKIPATTPNIATIKVAVVRSNSNWMSLFRTLSCTKKESDKRRMHNSNIYELENLRE